MQKRELNVAILLATYNGAKYVQEQLQSLRDNTTPFTLHWLDDHSTDDTRQVVRAVAQNADMAIVEWHHTLHLGLPGTYFRLLECVDADIYLFCDQDDIWQPGKIDAVVANLAPDAARPVLCSADLLQFNDSGHGTVPSLSERIGMARLLRAQNDPPVFLTFGHTIAPALTQAFTRPLREIFLKHKAIACTYASLHDSWMYDIAIAAGTARFLPNVPTALRRVHATNSSQVFAGRSRNPIIKYWQSIQLFRRYASRDAQGFLLAAQTLPAGNNLSRLVELAHLVATIDRRQSLRSLVRLARRGAVPWWGSQFWFSAVCLCSEATKKQPGPNKY